MWTVIFLDSPTLLFKAERYFDASGATHLRTQSYILEEGTYRDNLKTHDKPDYTALV